MADRLNESFKKNGLILRAAGPIIHIGPPICITKSEIDEIVHAIDLSLWELEGGFRDGPICLMTLQPP